MNAAQDLKLCRVVGPEWLVAIQMIYDKVFPKNDIVTPLIDKHFRKILSQHSL